MLQQHRSGTKSAIAALAAALAACGSSSGTSSQTQNPPPADTLAQALFVATTDGQLTSFDVASGTTRAGQVPQVLGPVDLQALPEGVVGVNLSGANEVLFVDAKTMLVKARFPSTLSGNGKRPVHSYLSPTHAGKRYWLALNDGASPALADPVAQAATNSALFVDVTAGAPTWLAPVGEVALGLGHHKAAFSATRERVVVSNISDCSKVFHVLDYSSPAAVQEVKVFGSADLGWDGTAKVCGTAAGQTRPSPHGCATSTVSGHAYCNLTGTGEIVSIDLDAAVPTLAKLAPPLGGTGAGATAAHPGGRFVFTAHNSPREGGTGAANQIGSLSVVDTQSQPEAVVDIPLFYDGPGATNALAGTDEEGTGISHLTVSADGKTLFVIPGSASATAARARRVLAVDVTDPAHPQQLASITVGASHGDNSNALSGDGKLLFVTNNADTTVSAIDVATRAVVRTFDTHAGSPKVVATFGTAEGCSKPVH
jgi:YVTN family beta-propeller protein